MTRARTLAAVAALLVLVVTGCQSNASLSSATPDPSSSELAAIIQTAVEDRNGAVLDTPPAPRLSAAQTTADYRAKREQDLPKVARSKAGFKSSGFWYASFSTTVTAESMEVRGPEISIRFKELTEEYLASKANGPSTLPEGYSLPQIATFRASEQGWKLDSITPSVHSGGLPMSVADG